MNPINENKNAISCLNPQYLNQTASPSQGDYFCILHNVIDDRLVDIISKRDNLNTQIPNVLKNIINAVVFELKSPLANVTLATEFLEISLLSAEQQMFVEILQRNAKRISNAIINLNPTYLKAKLEGEILKLNLG